MTGETELDRINRIKSECHDWIGHGKIAWNGGCFLSLFAEYTTGYWCVYNRENSHAKRIRVLW